MSATLNLPIDEIATIPVAISNQVGRAVAIPAGASVSIDNTAIATASLSVDGSEITVTPVGTGSCMRREMYRNIGLADLLSPRLGA